MGKVAATPKKMSSGMSFKGPNTKVSEMAPKTMHSVKITGGKGSKGIKGPDLSGGGWIKS